jgi:hypothetical protein
VTGIFKQKNPANVFLLLLFGILIKLPAFFNPHIPVPSTGDGILYAFFLKILKPAGTSNPVIYPLLSFVFLYLQAFLLNRFINQQRMTSHQTYYPGMAYLLITSLFSEWNYFSAPLLINTFLLFVLSGLFKTYNQANARGAIFNIGLAFGIASFIFFPSLTFIVWILLSLAVLRPFRLAEWVLCIVGATTPFYFYAVYLFITDQWNWQSIWPDFYLKLPAPEPNMWLAGGAFLLVMPFLTGAYFVQDNLRRMLIQVRKGWSLLLLYLLGALFIPFINATNTLENWIIVAIPFAAFHASMYLYTGFRIVPQLIFWLTVAFILAFQYGGPGW